MKQKFEIDFREMNKEVGAKELYNFIDKDYFGEIAIVRIKKDVKETISISAYFLMRTEPIAHNTETDEDVMGWVMIPNSERSYPYPKEELEGKKNWKQFKRTITEEEVI